jgi:regulator of cell morphogenesis and NO signaling
VTIAARWRPLRENMAAHLHDEEELLFPYIKQLAQRQTTSPSFGSAQSLIAQMGTEHEHVGDTLAELERLSGGYAVPEDGCNTYRALYGFLSEFEATTKKHIHLENNILFPKTIELEQEQAGVTR